MMMMRIILMMNMVINIKLSNYDCLSLYLLNMYNCLIFTLLLCIFYSYNAFFVYLYTHITLINNILLMLHSTRDYKDVVESVRQEVNINDSGMEMVIGVIDLCLHADYYVDATKQASW